MASTGGPGAETCRDCASIITMVADTNAVIPPPLWGPYWFHHCFGIPEGCSTSSASALATRSRDGP